ncbi:MAG: AraC family transcriptional regulator [Chitinophagaceae bacterium]
MSHTLRSIDMGEIPLRPFVPADLKTHQLPRATYLSGTGTFGQVMFQQVKNYSYEIQAQTYLINKPGTFTYTEIQEENTAYLLFNLCGSIKHCNYAHDNDNRVFHERDYNLSYNINPEQTIYFDKPGFYTQLKISCPRDLLSSLTGLCTTIDSCIAAIQQHQRVVCWQVNQVAPQKIINLLEKLFQPPVTDSLYEQYTAIKTIEIGLETLLHAARNQQRNAVSLSPQQVEDIYNIRDYILLHLNKRFATQELVSGTTLTPQTLKTGFRTLFGTGIYNFLAIARMEKSIELIRQRKNINTSSIASELGYADEISFIVSFKKHFGYNPMYFSK